VTDTVLTTHGLRKRFDAKLAVADLSLSLKQGEVFGFLGPNGAGKTTSLKMLLGLVEPSGGEATVLGKPLGDLAARARMGFLPEHFRFHDWLTGRELLRFHGKLYGMKGPRLEARIETLLARVDLLDAGERAVRGYSKGMLQRVGLAQAILNEPAIVFLDEPTSGLDPLGRRLVRDVIRELRQAGTTVFLNSHLLGEVEATCDRVAFVKEGRVVRELALAGEAVGGVEVEIRLTARGGGPVPAAVREELARQGSDLSWSEPGVAHLRVPADDAVPALARWLVGAGVEVHGLTARRPSLEDVFLAVMGDDQRPG
jgi:ABC-2 type transport system ATP-binding protein